ncbi:MAG: hypothetical protein K0Q49_1124 [Haloplasmataceae bacterium]|jgi:hypothetical protein|nr:hypothetical protein [Haloplasmataceae bacterium]
MSKRTTGTIFCLIATLLYCTRYLSAAINGSKLTLNERPFAELLSKVGRELIYLSLIALIVGIIYLILAELAERK